MSEPEEGGAKKKADVPKKEKRREQISIGLGIAGIIIVVVIAKAKSNAAAAGTTSATDASTSTSPYGSSGYTGLGGSDTNSADLSAWEASLNDQLQSLQTSLTGVQSQQTQLASNEASNAASTSSALASLAAKIKSGQPSIAVPSASTPKDTYSIGQKVGTNQTIVASVLNSAKTGWFNLTSTGGVYTSGGAVTQGKGSYLGYAASTPNPAAETAAHGNFSHGSIVAGPNGTYTEINDSEEKYTF